MNNLNELTKKLEGDPELMKKMETQTSTDGLIKVAKEAGFDVGAQELYEHIEKNMPTLHSTLCCSGDGGWHCGCNGCN